MNAEAAALLELLQQLATGRGGALELIRDSQFCDYSRFGLGRLASHADPQLAERAKAALRSLALQWSRAYDSRYPHAAQR